MAGAGSRYTEITLDDMATFLKRAYRALKPKQGESRGEVYYDLNLSDHKVLIRVWTSIRPRSGTGAGLGEDAIRVTMVTSGGKPLMPKGKIVMRTKNWKNALQDRIEDLLEVYEAKADYWKQRRQERDEGPQEATHERPGVVSPEPGDRPPPRSGELITGGYASEPSAPSGWAAQIKVPAEPGDLAMLSTKGGKKTKVKLTRKVRSTKWGDIWLFERPSRSASEDEGDFNPGEDLVESLTERYLRMGGVLAGDGSG